MMKFALVIVALSAVSSSAQMSSGRCSGPGTGETWSISRLLPGIFGQVLGDVNVEEPKFDVVLDRKDRAVPYEVREYGSRWTVGTDMKDSDDSSAFQRLAAYIGVFQTPQNEKKMKIEMTAPVAVKHQAGGEPGASEMDFFLPSAMDAMSKIPRPNFDNVKIGEVAPAVGAVLRFAGSMRRECSRQNAALLIKQLKEDGVELDMEEAWAAGKAQFWGFNPPMTLPNLRRNEVWMELTEEQLQALKAAPK